MAYWLAQAESVTYVFGPATGDSTLTFTAEVVASEQASQDHTAARMDSYGNTKTRTNKRPYMYQCALGGIPEQPGQQFASDVHTGPHVAPRLLAEHGRVHKYSSRRKRPRLTLQGAATTACAPSQQHECAYASKVDHVQDGTPSDISITSPSIFASKDVCSDVTTRRGHDQLPTTLHLGGLAPEANDAGAGQCSAAAVAQLCPAAAELDHAPVVIQLYSCTGGPPQQQEQLQQYSTQQHCTGDAHAGVQLLSHDVCQQQQAILQHGINRQHQQQQAEQHLEGWQDCHPQAEQQQQQQQQGDLSAACHLRPLRTQQECQQGWQHVPQHVLYHQQAPCYVGLAQELPAEQPARLCQMTHSGAAAVMRSAAGGPHSSAAAQLEEPHNQLLLRLLLRLRRLEQQQRQQQELHQQQQEHAMAAAQQCQQQPAAPAAPQPPRCPAHATSQQAAKFLNRLHGGSTRARTPGSDALQPPTPCLQAPASSSQAVKVALLRTHLAGYAKKLLATMPGDVLAFERVPLLGWYIWRRALLKLHLPGGLQPGLVPALELALGACLWIAAKLESRRGTVPKCRAMAGMLGISAAVLVDLEVQVMEALEWSPYSGSGLLEPVM